MIRIVLLLCVLGVPVAAERDRTFAAQLNHDVDEQQVATVQDHHRLAVNFTMEELSNSSSQGGIRAKRFLGFVIRTLQSEKTRTKVNNAGIWHLGTVVMMKRPWKTDEVILDILGFTGIAVPFLQTVCAVGEMNENFQDRDWCRLSVNGIHFFVELSSLGTAVAANACGVPPMAQMAVTGTSTAWGFVYAYLREKCGHNELRAQRVPLLSQCYNIDLAFRDEDGHDGWDISDVTDLPSSEKWDSIVEDHGVKDMVIDETYNPLHICVY
jgi:hypothetical protein